MATFSADKVLDNKIKVHKPVRIHKGQPESGIDVIELGAGRITPVVFSWVQQNGNLYWMFNELGTPYYLKHDPGFEIVKFSGGAEFVAPPTTGFPDLFNNFGGNLADTAVFIKKAAIGAGLAYGGLIAYRLYQASDLKKNFK